MPDNDPSQNDPLLHGIFHQHREDHEISADVAAEESRFSRYSHRVSTYHKKLRRFTSSKLFHRLVLSLVIIDTLLVISQLLLDLFICEAKHPADNNLGDVDSPSRHRMKVALKAVEETSFTISCVFVAELSLTLISFGWVYLKEWMHVVDSLVIIVGFAVDVALKGPVEEAASLLVVLRLWRIVKMAEEVVVEAMQEANEAFEALQERVDDLEKQNRQLKDQLNDRSED